MPTTEALDILKHLEERLYTIKVDNGYKFTVRGVDREYRERSYDEYPFIFINDIEDSYDIRICKDLYKKTLIVQIIGFVYDDRNNVTLSYPQLGTQLQYFKDDLQRCLAEDTYFNTSDLELNIIEITTEDDYVPPQASYLCHIGITYYSTK